MKKAINKQTTDLQVLSMFQDVTEKQKHYSDLVEALEIKINVSTNLLDRFKNQVRLETTDSAFAQTLEEQAYFVAGVRLELANLQIEVYSKKKVIKEYNKRVAQWKPKYQEMLEACDAEFGDLIEKANEFREEDEGLDKVMATIPADAELTKDEELEIYLYLKQIVPQLENKHNKKNNGPLRKA